MATEPRLLQRLARARPATWLLAAAAGWALLLWLGALSGMGGRVADAPAQPAGALPQAAAPAPDRIGPLGQYADAAARPLFTADRRPRSFLASAGGNGDGGDAGGSLDFILTGVLISPRVQLAILQPAGGGESQRVRLGDAPEGAEGWRLLDVQPRSAVFEGGGGRLVLDLRTFGSAGEPPGARDADAPAAAESVARDAAAAAREAADAAGADVPPPPMDDARVEQLRRRIEARRAQLRELGEDVPSPEPQ